MSVPRRESLPGTLCVFGAWAIGIIDKNNQLSAQNDVPKIAMQYHYKALQRAFGIIME